MKPVLAVSLWLGLLASACTLNLPRPARPQPDESGAGVRWLSPEETHALIVASYADERLIILDVRTPEEFQEGHLADAVDLDIRRPDFQQRLERLDRAMPYLVYCGRGLRSAQAVARMRLAGFREVYELHGGLDAWRAAGYPTTP